MAKGVGLIGNFKGKVGNTVGYSLKDSNNKQTQGIRVYQPVVRNPKTYAQAEQRMKLAPINATYRAIKMIIDRGQEGLAYGNKSRLAWLSDAIKAFAGGYFEKGAAITAPALVPLTKGSLPNVGTPTISDTAITLNVPDAGPSSWTNLGVMSVTLKTAFPFLKDGDQLTFVAISSSNGSLSSIISSIVLDSTSTDNLPAGFAGMAEDFKFTPAVGSLIGGAIIISREGDNGAHLRSTTSLTAGTAYPADIRTDAAKEAAIVSYMSQGANTDWAEESIMQ